jgi:hypothetical protein
MQPLKSFRDSTVRFPPYAQGDERGYPSQYLKSLGPLVMPPRTERSAPGAEDI